MSFVENLLKGQNKLTFKSIAKKIFAVFRKKASLQKKKEIFVK